MAIPDNYFYSLSQVRTELQITGTTAMCLSGVFTEAPNAPFDDIYEGSQNCLRSFRNYDLIKDYTAGSVGVLPFNMAFDGTNMWTANKNGDSVSKITPTGTVSTYSVGDGPNGITFDGTNIWTANSGTGGEKTISKIQSDGTVTTYNIGLVPYKITFDGTNLWTGNFNGSASKISLAGTVLNTYASISAAAPNVMISASGYVWIADTTPQMVRLSSTGVKTTYATAGLSIHNMVSDGTYIWGVGYAGCVLGRFALDGSSWTTYTGLGTCHSHIAYDGSNLWVTHRTCTACGCISKISTSGNLIRRYNVCKCNPTPIAYDNNGWMWYINYEIMQPAKIGAT